LIFHLYSTIINTNEITKATCCYKRQLKAKDIKNTDRWFINASTMFR